MAADLAEPDEQVGVRVVGVVRELDHWRSDHLERATQRAGGEDEHVRASLQSRVVSLTAHGGVDDPAADGRRGIDGVVGEGGGGGIGWGNAAAECAARVQVQHEIAGRGWPTSPDTT